MRRQIVIAAPATPSRRTALWQCHLSCLSALALPAVGMYVVLALLLLPVGLGFLLLPQAARSLRRLTDRSRVRVERWSGTSMSRPDPLPDSYRAVLADEGFWRDLRWAWLEPLSGGPLTALPLLLFEFGAFGALVQPFIWQLLGETNWYAFILVSSTATMLAALVLGLLLMAAGTYLAVPVLRLHTRWSGRRLAAPRSAELARRVERLTGSRAEALDIQAAELRRIERDLHDGAQARLVALGMTLESATRVLDTDPEAAKRLLLEVRETSVRALQDLRDLVAGIHPPVLADRGLGDAVRSLALDCFIDVRVSSRLDGRLPPPVESAAYFAVSEVLANAGKHSGAQEIRVELAHSEGLLRIEVTDDGRGGADLEKGTGLQGVRRRLGTFDGTLALHSPPGGPTTVTMELPCVSSSPKTSSFSGTG